MRKHTQNKTEVDKKSAPASYDAYLSLLFMIIIRLSVSAALQLVAQWSEL
jgi:hypothetical protein